jgi:hypothetical protein
LYGGFLRIVWLLRVTGAYCTTGLPTTFSANRMEARGDSEIETSISRDKTVRNAANIGKRWLNSDPMTGASSDQGVQLISCIYSV